ncbi:triosephosphate isomerase [Mycoplasmopsis mustelae]|uniref:Triosephosphate isomerase n=1 Tax=Mycoplasmopsis mustelae TaxID=171289 RepID=A0A4R7UF51_9BACT|nr:triose-phosphate isomerase [Mycoplasmopsis mustelae]TDV24255.1 triosephosphate isomerase [Mycoplasmopsis mustelae]
MNKKLIIGNWKMNKTFSETQAFLKEFAIEFQQKQHLVTSNVEFAIAMPFVNLAAFQSNRVEKLYLAAQDVSAHVSGAYTGEVSADMLKELNAKFVILGHSERRSYHKETDELVNTKAKLVLEKGLTPVICVGETLQEYEQGLTKEVVKKQILGSLKGLDFTKIVVAYEPIWAIGTGKVATPQIAQDVCAYIHQLTSDSLVVQYGGSVSPDNILELSNQKDINGFLVGGASLQVDSFIKLLTLKK